MTTDNNADNNDIDNDEDDTYDEDTVNRESTAPSPSSKDIRITQKNFSIREIYLQIEGDELDLAPDFQRSFVWDVKRQVRLIESILMGIPLPAFYFNQDKTGAQQVVDGVQRLTTIKRFMSNELKLHEDYLVALAELKNLTYDTLDSATKSRFSKTQLVTYIIEPQTPDALKYDIFNRVNTGGSPLTAQEIRHCMTKNRSRQFLKELVELPSFDKVTGHHFWKAESRDDKRMVNREYALRFCAFYINPIEKYSNAASLDAYLLECGQSLDQVNLIDDTKLAQLQTTFDQAMKNAFAILGKFAFRRYQGVNARRGPLNRAVFESQALALANYPLEILQPQREKVKDALLNLFTEADYDRAIATSTSNYSKLKCRIERPQALLKEILGC